MAFLNRFSAFKSIAVNRSHIWRQLSVLEPKNFSAKQLNRIEKRNVSKSLLSDLSAKYNKNFKGMSYYSDPKTFETFCTK